MSQLFEILYKSRNFFFFLIFQIICFNLMSRNNMFWNVSLFNSTNSFAGKSLEITNRVSEFINYGHTNKALVEENAMLRKLLTDKIEASPVLIGYSPDSLVARRFEFNIAKVIGSTTNLKDNFITIDKGSEDGIKTGMGVISPLGIVGQVSNVSNHYSRIYAVLHSAMRVSVEVKNKKLLENQELALGTCIWDGTDPRYLTLNNIDRFKQVAVGDTVVTSQQNAIFPSSIIVGTISEISNDPSEAFHQIKVKLSNDLSSLAYVYIVKNKFIEEQTEIEK